MGQEGFRAVTTLVTSPFTHLIVVFLGERLGLGASFTDCVCVGDGDRVCVGDGDRVCVGDGDRVCVGDGDVDGVETKAPSPAEFSEYVGLRRISRIGSGNSNPDTSIMMAPFRLVTDFVAATDPPLLVVIETTRADAASCGLVSPHMSTASEYGITAR